MEYWCSAYETAKLAAEVEIAGAELYTRLAPVTGNIATSNMCLFFAKQEQLHQAHFLTISEAHRSSDTEHCHSVDISAMLKASMHSLTHLLDDAMSIKLLPTTVSECLTLVARIETTSIEVYTKMKEQFASEFSTVLGKVIDEEREHLRMVQDVRHRLGI
jgi:rubrerythrin